jgi:hypothetical protein
MIANKKNISRQLSITFALRTRLDLLATVIGERNSDTASTRDYP